MTSKSISHGVQSYSTPIRSQLGAGPKYQRCVLRSLWVLGSTHPIESQKQPAARTPVIHSASMVRLLLPGEALWSTVLRSSMWRQLGPSRSEGGDHGLSISISRSAGCCNFEGVAWSRTWAMVGNHVSGLSTGVSEQGRGKVCTL
jgi:hypothetical protein